MTKKTFEVIVYSIFAIGAFLVEFLPVSIVCIALVNYQGIRIFFEIFEEVPVKRTKGYYLKKGIFLLLILIMLIVVMFVFMYRNKLLLSDS